MKPKHGLIAVAALVMIFGFVDFSGKPPEESSSSDADSPAASEGASPPSIDTPAVRRNENGGLLTLRAMIAGPVRSGSTEMARVSPDCREFEASLFGLALDKLGARARDGTLPDPSGCSPSDPRAAKILRHYAVQCSKPLSVAPSDGHLSEECQLALVMARSTLATLTREPRPISEMTDLRDLADLLVSEFGEMYTAMSPAALARLQAAADRMTELDPGLLPAVKAGAVAAMLDAIMKKSENPDWKDFERRIARVAELDPNDPDLDAFRRLADTGGMDPALVRLDSLERLEKKPGDWRELEVLAWSNWRLGKTDAARGALAAAIKQSPGNAELEKNWRAIQKPGAKRDDFTLSMKIGVGLSDLLR